MEKKKHFHKFSHYSLYQLDVGSLVNAVVILDSVETHRAFYNTCVIGDEASYSAFNPNKVFQCTLIGTRLDNGLQRAEVYSAEEGRVIVDKMTAERRNLNRQLGNMPQFPFLNLRK